MAQRMEAMNGIQCSIVCPRCISPMKLHGAFRHTPHPGHVCAQTILLAKEDKSTTWYKIRDRSFQKCVQSAKPPCARGFPSQHCKLSDLICPHPHNGLEQRLWEMEINGKVSIFRLIADRRRVKADPFENVASYFMSKYGGLFAIICKLCLNVRRKDENACEGPEKHSWDANKVLLHQDLWNAFFSIPLESSHRVGYGTEPKLCQKLQECPIRDQCNAVHHFIERDFALLRSHCLKMTIEEVCGKLNEMKETIVHRMEREAYQHPSSTEDIPVQKSPFQFSVVCKDCRKAGTHAVQSGAGDVCTQGHLWKLHGSSAVFEGSTGKWITVRPLPNKPPQNPDRLSMCRHVNKPRSCLLMDKCQYAHSELEKSVWTWQLKCQPKVLNLVEYITKWQSQVFSEGRKVEARIAAVASASRAGRQLLAVTPRQNYCCYCDKQCNSLAQYRDHCTSKEHVFKVTTDQDQSWNYRIPPPGGNFELCTENESGNCDYSNFPQQRNHCANAHSIEELEEWKARLRYREAKRLVAQQTAADDCTYVNTVFCEEVDGVDITCSQPLKHHLVDKMEQYTWTFHVKTLAPLKLRRVALKFSPCCLYFGLVSDWRKVHSSQKEDCVQLLDESHFTDGSDHFVVVVFKSTMIGKFDQSVVFDFGDDKRLQRKLTINVGSSESSNEAQVRRERITFTRWTDANADIVYCGKSTEVSQFPIPGADELVTIGDERITQLCESNYVQQMHKLLWLEELTRLKLVSRFSVYCRLAIANMLNDKSFGMLIAPVGLMYGAIDLQGMLDGDTESGQLIMSSCKSVLFTLSSLTEVEKPRVYEATLIPGIQQQDTAYIELHEACIQELGLANGMEQDIRIQFQLSRSHFVQMHEATDAIRRSGNILALFPTTSGAGQSPTQTIRSGSVKSLNDQQRKAVSHALEENRGELLNSAVPFILYGPFGTGKTMTLAEAAKAAVLASPKQSRILICTLSNSAADLYIAKHFHSHNERSEVTGGKVSILRIYYEERRTNTVSSVVQQYCKLNEKGRFALPSKGEVLSYQIVITTLSMSSHLVRLGLQGHFSHIFVDEAGQALETEVIIPLALAVPSTCVLLSGDHKQMSPTVYCQEARERNFHLSLLERLFLHYKKLGLLDFNAVLLHNNYRSCAEVVDFLSSAVYHGNECLRASRDALPVQWRNCEPEGRKPLNFYCTKGEVQQDVERCSYFNMAEVEEVAQVVEELVKDMPRDWNLDDICILTPYTSQRDYIRAALRAKRLGKVTVDNVQNIQGREFHAVLISAVRTRNDHVDRNTKSLGFLSDIKLVNTAISRVTDYVAVIGDPVALCATGSCRKLWCDYIRHCSQQRTLFPTSMSLEAIMSQAEQFPSFAERSEGDSEEMTPDEILQELAKQASQTTAFPSFTIEIDEGYGVLKVLETAKESRAQMAQNTDDEALAELHALLQQQPGRYYRCTLIINANDTMMASFLDQQAGQDMKKVGVQHIDIPDRTSCGRAFHSDEVVVEMLHCSGGRASGKVVGVLQERLEQKKYAACLHG